MGNVSLQMKMWQDLACTSGVISALDDEWVSRNLTDISAKNVYYSQQ